MTTVAAWAAWISDPRPPAKLTAKPGLVPGFVFLRGPETWHGRHGLGIFSRPNQREHLGAGHAAIAHGCHVRGCMAWSFSTTSNDRAATPSVSASSTSTSRRRNARRKRAAALCAGDSRRTASRWGDVQVIWRSSHERLQSTSGPRAISALGISPVIVRSQSALAVPRLPRTPSPLRSRGRGSATRIRWRKSCRRR
jgi:hypothetical protein